MFVKDDAKFNSCSQPVTLSIRQASAADVSCVTVTVLNIS